MDPQKIARDIIEHMKPSMQIQSSGRPTEFSRIPQKYLTVIESYSNSAPVPLGKIAFRLGIKVYRSPLPIGISGSISFKNEDYIIRINRFEARTRQRYSLAHELAHFLLHQNLIRNEGEIKSNVLFRSGLNLNIEYEANRLAAELIMPTGLVLHYLEKSPYSNIETLTIELSTKFQVSKEAMNIKLESLIQ